MPSVYRPGISSKLFARSFRPTKTAREVPLRACLGCANFLQLFNPNLLSF